MSLEQEQSSSLKKTEPTQKGLGFFLLQGIPKAFPVWITLGSVLALLYPQSFAWFITGRFQDVTFYEGGLVTPGLQVIMGAMGLSLTEADFRRVWRLRRAVFTGVSAQFLLMPVLGLLLARAFQLPPAYAAGMVLVACCPGGTASNVITYLAKADVALSVAMTTVSTLLAAVLTPTLTTLLVGQNVEVDAASLYLKTLQVVLFPLLAGGLLRRYLPGVARRLLPVAPTLAVLAIVLIVSGVLAVQKEQILNSGFALLGALLSLHGLAFLITYWIMRWRGESLAAVRAMSIEVGMQNSGLGVVLARGSFADPLVAVSPALSAVIHCLYGSLVAALWGRDSINMNSNSAVESDSVGSSVENDIQ